MLTKTIDMSEAQMSLNEVVSLVSEGVEVIFTEGNNPIARMLPIMKPMTSRIAGLHTGAIWISDDFDEPLPEEFWTESV